MSLSALSIVFVCGEGFRLLTEKLGLNLLDQLLRNKSAPGIRIQQSNCFTVGIFANDQIIYGL